MKLRRTAVALAEAVSPELPSRSADKASRFAIRRSAGRKNVASTRYSFGPRGGQGCRDIRARKSEALGKTTALATPTRPPRSLDTRRFSCDRNGLPLRLAARDALPAVVPRLPKTSPLLHEPRPVPMPRALCASMNTEAGPPVRAQIPRRTGCSDPRYGIPPRGYWWLNHTARLRCMSLHPGSRACSNRPVPDHDQ